MGRPKRFNDGGLVYHVLNRGNGGMRVFDKDADYAAFETILAEAWPTKAAPATAEEKQQPE